MKSYYSFLAATVLAFGVSAADFKTAELDEKTTKGLMPCRILGYSGVLDESDAQAHVYCPSHGERGWLANSEKIHFISLRLYTEVPGIQRAAETIGFIASPDQSQGLRQLFHSHGIVMAWFGQGILTGKMTELPEKDREYYGQAFKNISKVCAEFRKGNPDFVADVFNDKIHDLNFGTVWVSQDAVIYSSASTKSEIIPTLTDKDKFELEQAAATEKARFEKYQTFMLQFMDEKEFRAFDAKQPRERVLPVIEGLAKQGVDAIRGRKVVRQLTPQGALKRVSIEREVSTSYYYDGVAELILNWCKKEGVEVTTEAAE